MKISQTKSSSFFKNVVTLLSGNGIAQVITLSATPLLTRWYSPEEFGIFSLYIAIVGIISVVASWKYELAIMLPKKEQDAQALLILSIIIALITFLLIIFVVLLFKSTLINKVGGFEYFYWLVPLGILVTGLTQIFTAWNTRQLFYKNISISRIVQSCAVVSSQLSLSLFNLNSLGLIFGNLIGITISLTVLVFESIKNHTVKIKLVSETLLRQNFKRYDNFPKFQSFSVLINSFSQHLPVLLLISFYSPIIAGFYGLTYRALNTPARLLGGSVRQVYYQRASELFNNGRDIVSFYKKTTFGLIKITILPYLVIGIFAEKLFTVIFGAEWGISGIYAQILILFIFTITINPPTVMNIQILGIQKFHLKYEILLALCRFISIYVGFAVFNNHYISIGLFSVVGILFNVFLMIYVYLKLVKIEKTKLIYETN